MVSIENTPSGQRGRHERLARAIDASLAPAKTSFEQERRSQPRTNDSSGKLANDEMAGELAVVALLRGAADSIGPDPAARQRMYQRVLTGLGSVEPAQQAETPAGACRAHAASSAGKWRNSLTRKSSRQFTWYIRAGSSTHARLAAACAAALCLVFSISGLSLLLSKNALPGDALYGIKRSAETASLGLTFGEAPKAFRHMQLASARVDEIKTLHSRGQDRGAVSAKDQTTALADFNPEATAASRLLTQLGADRDSRLLETLRDWSATQTQRLTTVAPGLPAAAVPRLATTLDLLSRIAQRTTALLDRIGCTSVTSGASDEIGALPATDYCVPAPLAHKAAADPPNSSSAAGPRTDVRSTQPPGSPNQPSVGTQPPTSPAPVIDLPPLVRSKPATPRSTQPTGPPVPTTGRAPIVVIPLPVPPIDLPLGGLLGLPKIQLGR